MGVPAVVSRSKTQAGRAGRPCHELPHERSGQGPAPERAEVKLSFNSFVARAVRWIGRCYGQTLYPAWRDFELAAANASFRREVGAIGPGSRVMHPYYLMNPQLVTIGAGFIGCSGLRIEAVTAYHQQQFSPRIIIGNHVEMNFNVHIGAIDRIEIGDNVLVGSHVLITDHFHGGSTPEELEEAPRLRPLVSRGPTIVEEGVWIGEGACVMPGVRVGRGAIIGANAVVSRDVARGSVVAGVPARPLSDRPAGTAGARVPEGN
jgi:acetyltransferase-like isoleucine patch superfamily enzyme